jgi:hypothetical protein
MANMLAIQFFTSRKGKQMDGWKRCDGYIYLRREKVQIAALFCFLEKMTPAFRKKTLCHGGIVKFELRKVGFVQGFLCFTNKVFAFA